jgi:hypothetical protein
MDTDNQTQNPPISPVDELLSLSTSSSSLLGLTTQGCAEKKSVGRNPSRVYGRVWKLDIIIWNEKKHHYMKWTIWSILGNHIGGFKSSWNIEPWRYGTCCGSGSRKLRHASLDLLGWAKRKNPFASPQSRHQVGSNLRGACARCGPAAFHIAPSEAENVAQRVATVLRGTKIV